MKSHYIAIELKNKKSTSEYKNNYYASILFNILRTEYDNSSIEISLIKNKTKLNVDYALRMANKSISYSSKLEPINKQLSEIITKNKNNVIIKTKEELEEYVTEALQNKHSNKNLYLGVIPQKVINRINNKITDISYKNKEKLFDGFKKYQLVINQKEIRHLKKESLTTNDVVDFVNTLADLITNFDSVRYSIYNKSQVGLRFKKNMPDGTHIAFEVLSKQKGTMRTQTLFLDTADFVAKKRSTSPTLDKSKDSPSKTSEMDGGLASNTYNDTTNLKKVK